MLPLATLYRYLMPDGRRRNPDWEWDEIVLACDLVMLNDWQQIGAEDPRVVELSNLLQRMPLHPQEDRQRNFRNANGVARKTTDIATSAPDYQGGRTHGNALDRKVLDEFRARPDVMHGLAQSIRTSVTDGELPLARSAMRARARWRGVISSAFMRTASGALACAAARSKVCEGAVNRSPAQHAGLTSSCSTVTAARATSSAIT
jgi:5-methylcytosine-specific restriction protein A